MNKSMTELLVSACHLLTGRQATCALQQFIEAVRMGGVLSDPLRYAEERELRIITSRTRREKKYAARESGTFPDGIVVCHHAFNIFLEAIHLIILRALNAPRSLLPACETGWKRGCVTDTKRISRLPQERLRGEWSINKNSFCTLTCLIDRRGGKIIHRNKFIHII